MVISQRRVLNLLLVLAIAATATYWIVQFSSPGETGETMVGVATADRAARTQSLDVGPIAGLVGSGDVAAAPSNIAVVGVIAEGGKNRGVALLAVNGKPAMAYRAGETITGDLVLERVGADGVTIESAGVSRQLLFPQQQPPSGIDPVR